MKKKLALLRIPRLFKVICLEVPSMSARALRGTRSGIWPVGFLSERQTPQSPGTLCRPVGVGEHHRPLAPRLQVRLVLCASQMLCRQPRLALGRRNKGTQAKRFRTGLNLGRQEPCPFYWPLCPPTTPTGLGTGPDTQQHTLNTGLICG